MEPTLVTEGLKFMVLGMGVVFVFLALLVYMMKGQALLIQKYFTQPSPPAPVYPSTEEDEAARVAAIIVAVTEFRKQHPKG